MNFHSEFWDNYDPDRMMLDQHGQIISILPSSQTSLMEGGSQNYFESDASDVTPVVSQRIPGELEIRDNRDASDESLKTPKDHTDENTPLFAHNYDSSNYGYDFDRLGGLLEEDNVVLTNIFLESINDQFGLYPPFTINPSKDLASSIIFDSFSFANTRSSDITSPQETRNRLIEEENMLKALESEIERFERTLSKIPEEVTTNEAEKEVESEMITAERWEALIRTDYAGRNWNDRDRFLLLSKDHETLTKSLKDRKQRLEDNFNSATALSSLLHFDLIEAPRIEKKKSFFKHMEQLRKRNEEEIRKLEVTKNKKIERIERKYDEEHATQLLKKSSDLREKTRKKLEEYETSITLEKKRAKLASESLKAYAFSAFNAYLKHLELNNRQLKRKIEIEYKERALKNQSANPEESMIHAFYDDSSFAFSPKDRLDFENFEFEATTFGKEKDKINIKTKEREAILEDLEKRRYTLSALLADPSSLSMAASEEIREERTSKILDVVKESEKKVEAKRKEFAEQLKGMLNDVDSGYYDIRSDVEIRALLHNIERTSEIIMVENRRREAVLNASRLRVIATGGSEIPPPSTRIVSMTTETAEINRDFDIWLNLGGTLDKEEPIRRYYAYMTRCNVHFNNLYYDPLTPGSGIISFKKNVEKEAERNLLLPFSRGVLKCSVYYDHWLSLKNKAEYISFFDFANYHNDDGEGGVVKMRHFGIPSSSSEKLLDYSKNKDGKRWKPPTEEARKFYSESVCKDYHQAMILNDKLLELVSSNWSAKRALKNPSGIVDSRATFDNLPKNEKAVTYDAFFDGCPSYSVFTVPLSQQQEEDITDESRSFSAETWLSRVAIIENTRYASLFSDLLDVEANCALGRKDNRFTSRYKALLLSNYSKPSRVEEDEREALEGESVNLAKEFELLYASRGYRDTIPALLKFDMALNIHLRSNHLDPAINKYFLANDMRDLLKESSYLAFTNGRGFSDMYRENKTLEYECKYHSVKLAEHRKLLDSCFLDRKFRPMTSYDKMRFTRYSIRKNMSSDDVDVDDDDNDDESSIEVTRLLSESKAIKINRLSKELNNILNRDESIKDHCVKTKTKLEFRTGLPYKSSKSFVVTLSHGEYLRGFLGLPEDFDNLDESEVNSVITLYCYADPKYHANPADGNKLTLLYSVSFLPNLVLCKKTIGSFKSSIQTSTFRFDPDKHVLKGPVSLIDVRDNKKYRWMLSHFSVLNQVVYERRDSFLLKNRKEFDSRSGLHKENDKDESNYGFDAEANGDFVISPLDAQGYSLGYLGGLAMCVYLTMELAPLGTTFDKKTFSISLAVMEDEDSEKNYSHEIAPLKFSLKGTGLILGEEEEKANFYKPYLHFDETKVNYRSVGIRANAAERWERSELEMDSDNRSWFFADAFHDERSGKFGSFPYESLYSTLGASRDLMNYHRVSSLFKIGLLKKVDKEEMLWRSAACCEEMGFKYRTKTGGENDARLTLIKHSISQETFLQEANFEAFSKMERSLDPSKFPNKGERDRETAKMAISLFSDVSRMAPFVFSTLRWLFCSPITNQCASTLDKEHHKPERGATNFKYIVNGLTANLAYDVADYKTTTKAEDYRSHLGSAIKSFNEITMFSDYRKFVDGRALGFSGIFRSNARTPKRGDPKIRSAFKKEEFNSILNLLSKTKRSYDEYRRSLSNHFEEFGTKSILREAFEGARSRRSLIGTLQAEYREVTHLADYFESFGSLGREEKEDFQNKCLKFLVNGFHDVECRFSRLSLDVTFSMKRAGDDRLKGKSTKRSERASEEEIRFTELRLLEQPLRRTRKFRQFNTMESWYQDPLHETSKLNEPEGSCFFNLLPDTDLFALVGVARTEEEKKKITKKEKNTRSPKKCNPRKTWKLLLGECNYYPHYLVYDSGEKTECKVAKIRASNLGQVSFANPNDKKTYRNLVSTRKATKGAKNKATKEYITTEGDLLEWSDNKGSYRMVFGTQLNEKFPGWKHFYLQAKALSVRVPPIIATKRNKKEEEEEEEDGSENVDFWLNPEGLSELVDAENVFYRYEAFLKDKKRSLDSDWELLKSMENNPRSLKEVAEIRFRSFKTWWYSKLGYGMAEAKGNLLLGVEKRGGVGCPYVAPLNLSPVYRYSENATDKNYKRKKDYSKEVLEEPHKTPVDFLQALMSLCRINLSNCFKAMSSIFTGNHEDANMEVEDESENEEAREENMKYYLKLQEFNASYKICCVVADIYEKYCLKQTWCNVLESRGITGEEGEGEGEEGEEGEEKIQRGTEHLIKEQSREKTDFKYWCLKVPYDTLLNVPLGESESDVLKRSERRIKEKKENRESPESTFEWLKTMGNLSSRTFYFGPLDHNHLQK